MRGLGGGRSGGDHPALAVLAVVLAVAVIAFSGWLIVTYPPEADVPADAQAPPDLSAGTGEDEDSTTTERGRRGSRGDDPSDDASDDTSEDASPTAPQVEVAILGDGYTAGSPLGGEGGKAWPAVLAKRSDAETTAYAATGTGYVAGQTGATFEDRATELVEEWTATGAGGPEDAVVVLGSRSDAAADPAEVQAAAERTLTLLTEELPDVTVVAVGPLWPAAYPPLGGPEVREAVRAGAEAAGVTFVDPLEDPWLPASVPGAVATDQVLPTNLGHGLIAGEVRRLLVEVGVLDPA